MGTCHNCKTELSLQEGQTKCDKCGNIIWYVCHNCEKGFETAIEDGTKRKECKICGYFYCPYCGSCGKNCQKGEWCIKLKGIWKDWTSEKLQKTIDYFEEVKTSNERKECIKHIPITYAKGRIKSLMAKLEGFKVKNKEDQEAFNKRIFEITDIPIGTKLTITKIREKGSYGQEYRDAFNLLVCLGKLKLKWEKNEFEEEYALYERTEDQICPLLNKENLIINECPKCKIIFKGNIEFCPTCIKKKGKDKGQSFKLKKRLNNCDTCQMYRGDFNDRHKSY